MINFKADGPLFIYETFFLSNASDICSPTQNSAKFEGFRSLYHFHAKKSKNFFFSSSQPGEPRAPSNV